MSDLPTQSVQYNEDSIRSLDWREHIRLRPGMYIGKLGDGSAADDGIYVLLKETIDNCIDEYVMGHGKTIDVRVTDHRVEVRDYGRGIPLGKVVEVVSKINTGGKYDSGAFQKSVGLNGVGTKAVNALSGYFRVQSFRDGRTVFVLIVPVRPYRRSRCTSSARPATSRWWRCPRPDRFLPDKL